MDQSILDHKQFASLRHNAPKFQMAKAMLDDKLRLGFQTVPLICPHQLPKALDPLAVHLLHEHPLRLHAR